MWRALVLRRTMAPMRLFYGREADQVDRGDDVIVFAEVRRGVNGQSWIRPVMVKRRWDEPMRSRPMASVKCQQCLAQIWILCYSE
jgi:hypothetical protein